MNNGVYLSQNTYDYRSMPRKPAFNISAVSIVLSSYMFICVHSRC